MSLFQDCPTILQVKKFGKIIPPYSSTDKKKGHSVRRVR